MVRRVIVLIFALCLFAALLHEYTPPYVHGDTINATEAIAYWRSRIKEVGPARAHDEMVRAGIHIRQAHTLAHAFGEALFDSGPLSSIQYCGAGEYLYGCYHQFMGLAALQYGTSVLQTLKNVCLARGGDIYACGHSMGHSLLASIGYSQSNLDTVINDCSTIYDSRDYQGICVDGALMEYNLHEMTTFNESGGLDRLPRALTQENVYTPCLSMGTFKTECIYELPLWWSYALATTSENAAARYKTMAGLCESMPVDKNLKRVCMLGFGFPIAHESGFSTRRIIDGCSVAASTEDHTYCLVGAARRFFESGILHKKTACADLGLTDTARAYCEQIVQGPRTNMFARELGRP